MTKPVIMAGELGLTVPAGARTSLTCVASGSPPISYRWFRSTPGGKALLLSSRAELAWDSLQPSDAGEYYCEAENRVGAGAVRRSDAVELTVGGESPARSSSLPVGSQVGAPRDSSRTSAGGTTAWESRGSHSFSSGSDGARTLAWGFPPCVREP